ncbi:hypothetical protein, partial [Salmonella sp. 741265084_PSA]
ASIAAKNSIPGVMVPVGIVTWLGVFHRQKKRGAIHA